MTANLKIVVADDMPVMRKLLKTTLIKAGFENVEEAIDGAELLSKLQDHNFDLIICDWDMPKMSGIDALRAIRNNAEHKDIPFVMVTALAEAAKVQTAIEAGINDYVVKPIKPDVFLDKVKAILGKLNDSPNPATA